MVSGHALYLHAHGGIHNGAAITLYTCPPEEERPNCQWDIGGD